MSTSIIIRRNAKSLIMSVAFVLTILLLYMILCPSHILAPDKIRTDSDPAAGTAERQYQLTIPITIPDSQVIAGTILIQARNKILQPGSKWLDVLLFVSLLLCGCTVLLLYRLNRPVRMAFEYSPEISLYIGGHAPPVRYCC